jgi:hypothetical protein|nr:MAG TPA: hypothetical protein [Caudoviricetes sp.]
MNLKYDIEVNDEVLVKTLDRITNQIFKLLPNREEGGEWKAPLQNLIIELSGMDKLFLDQADFLPLISRLEALLDLDKEDDFPIFRKVIFESLSLMSALKKCLV